MTDLVPLTTRQLPAGTVMPAPAPAMTLSETERVCNMIAGGGDLVPPAYRGKPGAVLLAKLWGDANGVDLFTALQNISPIEGRPYVSAEMRVAMATARGFEFRVIESTREVCTLEVWLAGECRGSITARFTDQPRKLKTAKGFDTPWATHPDDMLFAEACRKADRRYVRTAAALLDASQDYSPADVDPLLTLARQAPPADDYLADDGLPANPEFDIDEPKPPASTAPEPVTVDATDGQAERLAHLVATAAVVDVKDASVLKEANRLAREAGASPVPDLAALAEPERAGLYDAVLDWLGEK